jgi:CheY-like chemotaxis protein
MVRGAGCPDLRRLHVLVVDDDGDARDVLAMVLSACGALVSQAASAREALGRLARLHPDLVVSDLGMTRDDGFWFARQARRLSSTSPVPLVALTGFDGLKREAEAAGFDAYLVKPFDLGHFCHVAHGLGLDVGCEAVASSPISRRLQSMPLLENPYDRRGRPICRVCARAITPEDKVALEDAMIHGRCAEKPGARKRAPSLGYPLNDDVQSAPAA